MTEIVFGNKTLIMGILNVTPDSFYDGGKHRAAGNAFDHAMKMLADGADIIDIGGESSRPGAEPVSVQEEIDRVAPVIEKILREDKSSFISVDTVKTDVARTVLEMGARMINNISGCADDSGIAPLCAAHDAWLVLMHMRGNPRTMQENTGYTDLCTEIASHLREAAGNAAKSGLSSSRIITDPGIGFAKTVEQNYIILNNIRIFKELGYPVLIGLSRKSLIGKIIPDGEDRLPATIALDAVASVRGADIVRVHDVKEHRLALDAVDMLRRLEA